MIIINEQDYELFLSNLGIKKALDFSSLIGGLIKIKQKPFDRALLATEMLTTSMLRDASDDDIVGKYFGLYHKAYDNWVSCLCMQDQIVILRKLAKAMNNPKNILDIGCGTCHQYTYLKKIGATTAIIDGIDATEEILDEGREIAKNHGVNLNLMQGMMPRLEAVNGSYDFISAIDALHWTSSWKETIPRMVELLAPNGKIFVVYSEHSPRVKINLEGLISQVRKFKLKHVEISTFSALVSHSPRVFLIAEKG